MKYITILVLLLLSFLHQAVATHNRAGYITYEQIGERTFKCTLITYTSKKPGVIADRRPRVGRAGPSHAWSSQLPYRQ